MLAQDPCIEILMIYQSLKASEVHQKQSKVDDKLNGRVQLGSD